MVLHVKKSTYILPKCCTFIQINMQNLYEFPLSTFDLVYMDPPWLNKSVKRGAKYKMHTNAELFDWCRLDSIISERGLVAIWITNKPAIEDFTRSYMSELGLVYAGEWVWVKRKFFYERHQYRVLVCEIVFSCSEW